jgi:hypothetical protein
VKPIQIASLREIIREKLRNSVAHPRLPTKSVASILEQDLDTTIRDWMALVEQDEELTCVLLSFDGRTGHLPNLIADLIYRLRFPPAAKAQLLYRRTPSWRSTT